MTNTNNYVTNELIKSIKYYSNSWSTIGRYFLLFPLGINLIKAKTIHSGIEAMIGYPVGIITLKLYGGLFGFGAGIHKHQNKVLPKLPDYTIAVISTTTDEMHAYAKFKLDEISKKF
jgi:hypothetical protein